MIRRAPWNTALWVAAFSLVAQLFLGGLQPALAAETTIRVLSIDGDTGEMHVVDGHTGEIAGSFTAPGGGFSAAYATDDGRYFLVNHSESDATTLIDSGLTVEPHGDHVDLEVHAPFVRSTLTLGGAPAHAWVHDGIMAIAYDTDGTVAIVDQSGLETGAVPTVFPVAQADHASIATIGNTLLVGYYELGRVDAYGLDGSLLQENLIDCPGTHGEARLGDTIAFACEDGIALVSGAGASLTATKMPYLAGIAATPESPSVATPAEASAPPRSNLLAAHEASPVMVGDLPGGLALIDPLAETLAVMPLPGQPLWMDFATDGQSIAVLTSDGVLRAIDPVTRTELWSTEATTPYTSFSQEEANAFYPFISVAADRVFVPDPGTGDIVVVDMGSGEVLDRHDIGGRPARVVAVAASGIQH